MTEDEETTGHWDKGRVETFSDGVFAIAITLLILDITVPSDFRHLSGHLEHEWPAYLAYVTSFLTVGAVWIAHNRLFSSLRFLDSMMMRINLVLLLSTAFLPFPTKILAEALRAPDATAQTAVILYGGTVLVIELILQAAAGRVTSRPDLVYATRSDTAIARQNSSGPWWLSLTVVLYSLAFCVALADFPKVAAGLYLVLSIRGGLLLKRHRWRPRSGVKLGAKVDQFRRLESDPP